MRIVTLGELTDAEYKADRYFAALGGIMAEKVYAGDLTASVMAGDIILANVSGQNGKDMAAAVIEARKKVTGLKAVFFVRDWNAAGQNEDVFKDSADACVPVSCEYGVFEKVMNKCCGEGSMLRNGEKLDDFGIVGNSEQIRFIINFIKKVAPSDIAMLIEGESGTGKELVAHGIHKASLRADKPFIPVNCGAIPKELLENEFFGHEKGSYTGAIGEKKGLFEIADGGTLFIDEIGEMDPTAQVKLLRVLETGRFMRIGGDREIQVNVRIVTATNKNVKEEMREGRFRKDLFYRLSAIMIKLPPLRERRADIGLLAAYFLMHSRIMPGEAAAKKISKEGLEILRNYDWPGNIRELLNVVERAVVLSGKNPQITQLDFPEYLAKKQDEPARLPVEYRENLSLDEYVGETEKQYIQTVLLKCGGDRIKTADLLRISIANMYRKIKKYNID